MEILKMRRKKMTQKELLYMEDAIGHCQNLETIFTNFSNAVEDSELQQFLEELARKQRSQGEKLLKVMEDTINEG